MSNLKHLAAIRKLTVAVQVARKELTKASAGIDVASQMASVAKRKRKEARETARRAKKLLKRAKRKWAEAKDVLESAEKKLEHFGLDLEKPADTPLPTRARKSARKTTN